MPMYKIKSILKFLITLLGLLGSGYIHARVDVDNDPPSPNDTPKSRCLNWNISYDGYEKGQINLDKIRLYKLFEDTGDIIINNKDDECKIRKISFTGYADTIKIRDQHEIYSRLPASVRPSSEMLVTNIHIAEGRSRYIYDKLQKYLGIKMPSTIEVKGIDGLPPSEKNRKISIELQRLHK